MDLDAHGRRLRAALPAPRLELGRAAVLAIVVLLLTAGVLQEAVEARPKILLLFDEDRDFPGLAIINRSLREAFTSELAITRSPGPPVVVAIAGSSGRAPWRS